MHNIYTLSLCKLYIREAGRIKDSKYKQLKMQFLELPNTPITLRLTNKNRTHNLK